MPAILHLLTITIGMDPNIAKFGDDPEVEITDLVSPRAYVASMVKRSATPVGTLLICRPAVTEPPILVSG